MDGSPKLSRPELFESLRTEFEQTISQVADAVNNAPEGRVIAGSEHQVKDLMDGLRTKVFQRALQLKADSVDSASSPGMLSKGYAVRSPLTVCGRVELKRRRCRPTRCWTRPGH